MSCNANPGVVSVTVHGKTFKRALKKAFEQLLDAGNSECAGGVCAGGICEWQVQAVEFEGHFDVESASFHVTASGTGSCECA